MIPSVTCLQKSSPYLPCLAHTAQRLTKQPKQALDKLEQPCDSWSSSTLPRTYVNNTDDFKEYKCGIAAVDKSYSPGCCAYFPSNSIMHTRDKNQLCRNTPLPWLQLLLLTVSFQLIAGKLAPSILPRIQIDLSSVNTIRQHIRQYTSAYVILADVKREHNTSAHTSAYVSIRYISRPADARLVVIVKHALNAVHRS